MWLAHSACLHAPVSRSHTVTSLFPCTADTTQDCSVGCVASRRTRAPGEQQKKHYKGTITSISVPAANWISLTIAGYLVRYGRQTNIYYISKKCGKVLFILSHCLSASWSANGHRKNVTVKWQSNFEEGRAFWLTIPSCKYWLALQFNSTLKRVNNGLISIPAVKVISWSRKKVPLGWERFVIGSWNRRSQQTSIPALVPTVSQLWQGSTTKDVITPDKQTYGSQSQPRIEKFVYFKCYVIL